MKRGVVMRGLVVVSSIVWVSCTGGARPGVRVPEGKSRVSDVRVPEGKSRTTAPTSEPADVAAQTS